MELSAGLRYTTLPGA